jgi:hypothetical protein
MHDEAFHTVWGLYHVIYETKGYWFRTPEAWEVNGNFRASMYMRPAAAWAMEMMPDQSKSAGPRTGNQSELFQSAFQGFSGARLSETTNR